MAKPTQVKELNVHHHDDSTTTFASTTGENDIGYYPHRLGLDVVGADGQVSAHFGPEDMHHYTATKAA